MKPVAMAVCASAAPAGCGSSDNDEQAKLSIAERSLRKGPAGYGRI